MHPIVCNFYDYIGYSAVLTAPIRVVIARFRANCSRGDDLRAIDGEIQARGIGAAIVLSPHAPIRAAIIGQTAICCADGRAARWRPCSVHADFHHSRPSRIGTGNCRSREQQQRRCYPHYASADHAIHRVSPGDLICRRAAHSSSASTISDISQRWSVTLAAIAGVTRDT
jgi:hypothetical protein